MKRTIAVVAIAVVGLGLFLARPNLAPVWARINDLTQGLREGGMGETSSSSAEPEIGAEPTEPQGPQLPRAMFGQSQIAVLAAFGTLGTIEAARPPWPEIVLSSTETVKRIGLETTRSIGRMFAPTITGNAEIAYNANRYAEIRPRVPGLVHQVIADEGLLNHRGDPLLTIDSAEVGTAKADYLAALPIVELAQKTLDMTLELRKDNAAPLKDELMARADLNKAKATLFNTRQKLLNLGLTDSDLARIAHDSDTSSILEIVSPIEGVVVERHCVAGEAVQPTDRVFVVADIRNMWAWIDIYESEIDEVRIGQPVRLTISGTESPVFQGKVDWIDAAVNPATRTIRVRAEVQNIGDRLRAFEFGRARIQIAPERKAVFVPKEAVQTVGPYEVVFLPLGDARFQPKPVVTREADEPGLLEVLSGLAPNQEVVTTGSFLLKAEMLRDQIAGD